MSLGKIYFENLDDYMLAVSYAVSNGVTFEGRREKSYWVLELTGGY